MISYEDDAPASVFYTEGVDSACISYGIDIGVAIGFEFDLNCLYVSAVF